MIEHAMPDHAAPATVASAGEFASSLAARYGSRAFVASGADLALAFASPSESATHYASNRIEIAPRISIEHNYALSAGDPAPLASTAFDESRATALFERLFTRHARFTPFDASGEPIPATPVSRQLPALITERVSAVERVLPVRDAAAQTRPATTIDHSTPAPHKPDPGWGAPFTPRETPSPVTLPAPEIRRVADQVMREIDHRARALRERTGKLAR